MELKLFNTLTRTKEVFKPLKKKSVGVYSCGPTVYQFAHIGNLRAYLFADLLCRTLEFNQYKVKQVVNITDVGHLTSDADEGEDKVEQSARDTHQTIEQLTGKYTEQFKEDLQTLNIEKPSVWPKASEHIKEQIDLIKKLEKKGFTYQTSDGIYFDTSKFKGYGMLAHTDLAGLKEGARVEKNPEKKNPTDFALWKFSPKGSKRLMEWPSPWGVGFPGWHIECSAMSMKHLGQTFDIHTGGIDHIPVHHTNEIAQSEAATGKPFVHYWLHSAFLTLNQEKMAKSTGNLFTLSELVAKGFKPVAFRYLNLLTHYRQSLEFSLEALTAAQNALENLYERVRLLDVKPGKPSKVFIEKFQSAINDDLNAPQALAVMWELLKSKEDDATKKATLFAFDHVLGLGLKAASEQRISIPAEMQQLLEQREAARKAKDFAQADELRKQIEAAGFVIDDTPGGARVKRK